MDSQLLSELQSLRAQALRYQGHNCRIIEILDGENSLVLQCEDRTTSIQPNQYGEASRRAPLVHTLPLFDQRGELNPLIASWLHQAS